MFYERLQPIHSYNWFDYFEVHGAWYQDEHKKQIHSNRKMDNRLMKKLNNYENHQYHQTAQR